MVILKKLLKRVRKLVFAETDNKGKVSQIKWNDDQKSGVVSLHVPVAAYRRFARRAVLRATRIKIPKAKSVKIVKDLRKDVRLADGTYHLVQASFKL